MEIRDQVAVVTGAAMGIGRATALALARAGARGVALADVEEAALDETAAEVERAGAKALAVPTDVREPAQWERLLDRTESALGTPRILHNNAGVATATPTWPDLSIERIELLVDVNLKGVILGTRLALPRLQAAGGGVIVQTASMAAHAPLPPEAVYCATKAGVVMFTQACSPLAQSHGVRVNCVCPGVVETPMLRKTGLNGEIADYLKPIYAALVPLDPAEVADAVLALVRDDQAVARIVDVNNRAPGASA
jgi:NAD(P)-dependent dehydrogenase (short-subunit alcohol dehydrogenase family)